MIIGGDMKKAMVFGILLMITSVSAQETAPKISDLEWMAGCWVQKGKTEGSFMSERWTKPLGMMIGTNRTVKENLVKSFEYLRIEQRSDGIYYVAKPSSAKSETGFKLVSLDKEKAVFENKKHDFPTRLIYSRGGEGVMAVRVENDTGGFGIRFLKDSCEQ